MGTGGSCVRIVGFTVALGSWMISPAGAQQMISGPEPPPGTDRGFREPSRAQVVLAEVPAYIWHHGCGPTASGMVIGYYDTHGFEDLVPGSAATQTAEVNAMIADDSGTPDCSLADGDHYQDYSCPRDDSGPMLPDRSQTGGAHPSNCVADFMRTSWSLAGNRYGWAWGSDLVPAFLGYVGYVSPYWVEAETRSFSQFNWAAYRAEIDAGHPVGLLVDTDGNGQTDHFVTAIGYNTTTNEYACRDTWDTGVHWFDWSAMSGGNPWGVYSATTYHFYPLPDLVVVAAEVRPATPACLDSVEARAAVHNQGEGDSDWFWVQFRCGDSPPADFFVPYLAPGETLVTDWVSLGPLSAGSQELQTCADASDVISEADETNNCHLKQFDVEPCPTEAVPGNDPAAGEPSAFGDLGLRLSVANPYRAGQAISCETSAGGAAGISIYDAGGRRLRSLLSGPIGPGRAVVRWDGRDQGGRSMPSGVYFLQATVGTDRVRRALVYAK